MKRLLVGITLALFASIVLAVTPMTPDNVYTDVQGTTFAVATNATPGNGALAVSILFRGKMLVMYCDAARLSDAGFAQFKLVGTNSWFQMQFAPMRSGFVPA